jgi:hypothetical protein
LGELAAAYVDGGGVLDDEWRRLAELVDLGSLISLSLNAGARADEVARRIVETLDR